MATEAENEAAIRRMGHAELVQLWGHIQAGDTPQWEPGRAFEYLILRAFEVEGAVVRYPFSIAEVQIRSRKGIAGLPFGSGGCPMKAVIITEGRADQLLLQRLLGELLPQEQYQVVPAGGRSSAESLARTYLADSDFPVALVLDADTTDDQRVREQELILNELLRSVGPSRPFIVLLAKPEVEICLFEDRATAEDLFGRALTDEQWTRAHFQPYLVARELVHGSNGQPCGAEDWVQRLNETALDRVAQAPLITRLRDFIVEATSLVGSSSASA